MIKKYINALSSYISKKKYYSCPMINGFFLQFDGRVDMDHKVVGMCYEDLRGVDIPAVALGKTGKETIEKIIQLRAGVISEGEPSITERVLAKGCEKCGYYKLDRWKNDGLIKFLNLSMYPAPCQGKCFYCSYENDLKFEKTEAVVEGYNVVFDAIEYAIEIGLIAPDAEWQISSGEITIHPYKDRILDIVKNRSATFYTNAFLYDEKIGANLKANPNSKINLSIDAGTAETWRKIKGFDNFKDVMGNLEKYQKSSSRAGQIVLKYIVLPDINTGQEDYTQVIKIMNALGVKHMSLAYDVIANPNISMETSEKLIGAAGCLLAMLKKNNIKFDMHLFAPNERESIQAFANKLLASGKV